jgi:hypothetical protein
VVALPLSIRVELMQSDLQSYSTTSDVAFAAVLARARMRSAVRSVVADLQEARVAHAAILEARRRSTGKDAGAIEASRRRINASRELLRRLA